MTRLTESADMTLTDKAAVDELLKDAKDARASDALKRAILEDFDAETRAARKTAGKSFGLGGLFKRFRLASAGAVAGVSALGVATGVMTANAGAALTPEEEFYRYAEGAYSLAFVDNEGEAIWDAD